MATGRHSNNAKKQTPPASTGKVYGVAPQQSRSAQAAQRQAAQSRAKQQGKAPKSGVRHAFAAIAILAALALVVCIVVFKVLPSGNTDANVLEGQEITIEVAEGSTSASIAEALVKNGVIANAKSFNDAVNEQNVADQLKAGTYRFTGGEDVSSIIETLVDGNTGYTLTIPEGYTAKQISKLVAKTCEVKQKEFYKLTLKANKYVDDYPFLEGVYNNSMEGYLFPDTYNIPYGSTADDIVRAMLDNFASQIASVDMSYATGKNLDTYDVVTLASMIEKESSTSSDKAGIAGVFYNRLHAKMNLGSDVTTYYAVGKELTEELTAEDLASDSPYNTRNPKNLGLPAGPICCPGLEALTAAAQPEQSKYLYFFYSNSKQKTMFFKNAQAFNKAWAKYGD